MCKLIARQEAEHIAEAAAILRAGGVIAFPTDTLYGLGAHAFLEDAVRRVYAIKRRPLSMALSLLVADCEQIREVCLDIPALAWKLAERFLPGPLTLVLRRSPRVPDVVTAGGATVGVRIPAHPLALALLKDLDAPITGTSANLSGGPSPTTAGDVSKQLGSLLDYIVDGGPCPIGVESTVVDLTSDPPTVLRSGAIPMAQLEAVCGFPLGKR